VKHFGIKKKHLGWNATPVETVASDSILLYQSDFGSQLGSSNRCHITAWSSSDDNHSSLIHGLPSLV
jgi:hypothetical protein